VIEGTAAGGRAWFDKKGDQFGQLWRRGKPKTRSRSLDRTGGPADRSAVGYILVSADNVGRGKDQQTCSSRGRERGESNSGVGRT